MKLIRLWVMGVMLLGGAGCVWDHGHERGGGDRGSAGYSDQRGGDRGDMRHQGGEHERHDEQRFDDRR